MPTRSFKPKKFTYGSGAQSTGRFIPLGTTTPIIFGGTTIPTGDILMGGKKRQAQGMGEKV